MAPYFTRNLRDPDRLRRQRTGVGEVPGRRKNPAPPCSESRRSCCVGLSVLATCMARALQARCSQTLCRARHRQGRGQQTFDLRVTIRCHALTAMESAHAGPAGSAPGPAGVRSCSGEGRQRDVRSRCWVISSSWVTARTHGLTLCRSSRDEPADAADDWIQRAPRRGRIDPRKPSCRQAEVRAQATLWLQRLQAQGRRVAPQT